MARDVGCAASDHLASVERVTCEVVRRVGWQNVAAVRVRVRVYARDICRTDATLTHGRRVGLTPSRMAALV